MKYYEIYAKLINLYPKEFKEKYLDEILRIYSDIEKDTGFSASMFIYLIYDLLKSTVIEHLYILSQKNMIKTSIGNIPVRKNNIFGIILLSPVFLVALIDLISRIANGNRARPNLNVMHFLNNSLLYSRPIIFIWLLIFPVIALVINIPQVVNFIKSGIRFDTLKQNIFPIGIICFSLFILFLVRFHDFAPCVVKNIASGNTNINSVMSYCRNV